MRYSCIILLLLLAFSSSFVASAQSENPPLRLKYFLSIQAGGLFSRNAPSFSTRLTQGLRYGRMALGLGLGYDVYTHWRTMPLLASISWDVFRIRGNSFFTQVGGGYSWIRSPLVRDGRPLYFYDGPNPCLSGAAGYRIHSGKYDLYLSAGYKFQRIRYGAAQQGSGIQTHVQMDVERMTVKIGFGI